MMKTLRAFGLFLVLTATVLLAQDACWVEKTYQWSGNGTTNTQAFPLFGEKFSVRYQSPNAGLRVIFVPLERDSQQTLKNTSVVNTKNLITKQSRKDINTPIRDAAKKSDPALCWGYLFISGKGPWYVAIDQYVDSFQGWHLNQALKDQKAEVLNNFLGVWADNGTKTISFTPTVAPWKISATSETDGAFNVKVRKQDQKIFFEASAGKAGEKKSGWIYSLEPVTIEVTCATDEQLWTIEAITR